MQCSSPREGLDRHDVPNILLSHMSSNEVDRVLGVACPISPTPCLVLPPMMLGSAFHLDAPKPPSDSNQHILGIDVSPRLGNSKIEFASSSHKLRLRRVSNPTGSRASYCLQFDHLAWLLLVPLSIPTIARFVRSLIASHK
jgi:hypothetical protein